MTNVDVDINGAKMSLHYGVSEGKIVLMVADSKGPIHRISMTPREWSHIVDNVPKMNEGDVNVIDNHVQVR